MSALAEKRSPRPTDPRPIKVSDAEWRVRVELAACYRQCHKMGITDLIYTHISARVPGHPTRFIVNSNGLLFEEVTASSLVTIDVDGTVVTDLRGCGPIPGGYNFHCGVYAVRPEANAAVHTHTVAGIAVGAQKNGLLPVSQHAAPFTGRITYYDYPGFLSGDEERQHFRKVLTTNSVFMLRNHGILTIGRDIREAFLLMHRLEMACRQQVAMQSCGVEFHTIDPAVAAKAASRVERSDPATHQDWQALVRVLEREDPSFAT